MIDRKHRADVRLILLLLAAGFALWGVAVLCRTPAACAVVTVDGREVARYSLAANGVYPLNGGTNTLVIENGAAFIRDADCPDKLCEKQGTIRYAGQSITCLPNRVQIRLEGAPAGADTEVQ